MLLRLVSHLTGETVSDRIERQSSVHPFATHRSLADDLAEIIETEANRLLPRFVRDMGALEIKVAPQEQWHLRRAIVSFLPLRGGQVPLDLVPAGVRTWSILALRLAFESLLLASWQGQMLGMVFSWDGHSVFGQVEGEGASSLGVNARLAFRDYQAGQLGYTPHRPVPLVTFVDEPEVHLHMTAQRDAADVLARVAEEAQGVVAATHSLELLNQPSGRLEPVLLTSEDGRTTLHKSTRWSALAAQADALGISPSGLAQVCRGVLLVEGGNDRRVIQAFGGVDLDAQRILIGVLQGESNVLGLVEAELLWSLGIPVFAMLDHVRSNALRGALDGKPSRLSREEATLKALHESLRRQRLAIGVVPFAPIDIVCAIPDQEITSALEARGKSGFTTWTDFNAAATRAWEEDRTKFKDYFNQRTGLSVEQVIDDVIRRNSAQGGAPDSPVHSSVLKEYLSRLVDAVSIRDSRQDGVEILGRRRGHRQR